MKGLALLCAKIHYKVVLIKTVRYWHVSRQTDEWNRIQYRSRPILDKVTICGLREDRKKNEWLIKWKMISHFHKVQNRCSCLAGSPPGKDSGAHAPCIFSSAMLSMWLLKFFWRISPFHMAEGKEDGGSCVGSFYVPGPSLPDCSRSWESNVLWAQREEGKALVNN